MKKTIIAALVAAFAFGAYAVESTANWEYDSETKTISDGVWTINATLNESNITTEKVTDDGYPTEVSPLDLSKKVVKKGDPSTEYKITVINALFWYYEGGHKYKDGGEYVGKFTLPGEGLVTMGGDGVSIASTNTSHVCGDIVIPSTVTSIGRCWFQRTKITSITFGVSKNATIASDMCSGCKALTSVVFRVGGTYTILNNARPFSSCDALKNADLSGVVTASTDRAYAVLGGCTSLTNVTLNSNLVLSHTGSGTIGNTMFNNNIKLATVRFTGAAPDELQNWIDGDGGYLGILSSSQDIATIVPAQYRNTKNASGKCWVDYSASGRLNTKDSTFAPAYVKSDMSDLSKRKLLLDRTPEDEPPTVEAPTVIDVWAYQATVTANGSGLNGGTVFLSLTNATGAVTGPVKFDNFGKSHTFKGLNRGTEYAVIVVATNAYGSVTNDAVSFTTLAKQADVSVAKGGDADYNKAKNGSFVISRAAGDATDYPLTVKYTIGGTAVAGTDYTALPATATIPVGASSVTIDVVPLYCKTEVEGDTTVSITLTDDPGYAIGTRTATVNVAKVEVRYFSIAAGDDPTSENPRGTFIVSRGANDPIDQKVTLTYTISGAGSSAIFPLSGTVVIPPYATSATIDVFGNNASGSDAPLTVTLDDGGYTLITASATITVKAGAASEYWLVDTSAKTMSWHEWKFSGVDTKSRKVTMGNGALKACPATTSPLDFSLPVVDADGNRYVIDQISARGATATQKAAIGELTLPGEGMTGIDYAAFSGCANMTGTLVFPTSCSGIGGESFNGCTNITILGSSITGWTTMPGKDTLSGVSFEGEALALSLVEVRDGGFYNSKVESIRFGPGLKTLGRWDGRNGFFQNCAQLTNVVFDANSRVSLEKGITFSGCTSLRSIDLSAVTNIDCNFTVNDKTAATNISAGTFYKCSALTNIIFGIDLHYLASNVFENAFDGSAAKRTITFTGLPPEHFDMPYLFKSSADMTITTCVSRKYLSRTNVVGMCWLDYANGGEIKSKGTTWASDYLPDGVDPAVRPLLATGSLGLMVYPR